MRSLGPQPCSSVCDVEEQLVGSAVVESLKDADV